MDLLEKVVQLGRRSIDKFWWGTSRKSFFLLHFYSLGTFGFTTKGRFAGYCWRMVPHPLQILSADEINLARQVILDCHPDEVIDFREIYLREPPKVELLPFLEAGTYHFFCNIMPVLTVFTEHSHRLSPTTPRPVRCAKVQYDSIGRDKIPKYSESVVDLDHKKRVQHVIISEKHHAPLTL
jgi:primary-amine oxidase